MFQIDSKNFAAYVLTDKKLGVAKLTVLNSIAPGGGTTPPGGGGNTVFIPFSGQNLTNPFSIRGLLNLLKLRFLQYSQ